MRFEFEIFGALVSAAWVLCLPVVYWPSILISFLVFSSGSIPVSLMLLLALQLTSFVHAILGSGRSRDGVFQRRAWVVLVGTVLSLVGVALGAEPVGKALTFFGIILGLPNAVTGFFLNRFYETMTLRAFLGSVLLPALVSIHLLLKVRADVKPELGPIWDGTVLAVGMLTFLHGNFFALLRRSMKLSLIHLAHGTIGLSLFLVAAEAEPLSQIAFTAIAIASISTPILLNTSWQLGEKYFSFARLAALGMPGLVGFTALSVSMKLAMQLGNATLGLIFLGYLPLSLTLILMSPRGLPESGRPARLRFWAALLVQLLSGCWLFWLASGGVK